MKDYRVGTDIKIKWKVSINEGTIALEDADLTLQVCNRIGQKIILPIAVEEDVIEATFYGKQQKAIGYYSLTLWLNYGKVGQAALDHIDAFSLVPFSSYILDKADPSNMETNAVVELEGSVTMGLQGDSAYQSWLRQGYEGSEADFVAWIREPAVEAYFEASAKMEEFAEQENLRGTAEQTRQSNESSRQSNETIRIQHEENRETSEVVRVEAELERQSNEIQRLDQEAARESQEQQRVEADARRKGIDHIELTSTQGLVDTYTIYYTNGATTTYQVTNGKDGETPDVSKFVQLNAAGVVSQVNAPMQRFHMIMVDEDDQRVAGLNYVVSMQEFEVWGYKQGIRPPRLQLLGTEVPNPNVLYFDESGTPHYFDGTGLIPIPTPYADEIGYGESNVEEALDNLEENKQDKLVAGSNITIEGNVISSSGGGGGDAYTKAETDEMLAGKVDKDNLKTINGESIVGEGDIEIEGGTKEVHVGTDEPTEGEVLWIDPNEQIIEQTTGQATDKVMSQKAVTDVLATKQHTLTAGENITIENNVISAVGGGGGTPSGHPMHDAFVGVGAVWNNTTKFWEMNMLTDLTNEEMVGIYSAVSMAAQVSYTGGSAPRYFNVNFGLRTYPMLSNTITASLANSFLGVASVISLRFGSFTTNNIASAFRACTKLEYILGEINFTATAATASDRAFENCTQLELVKIKGLKVPLSFAQSPNLNQESILHIINNSAATSAITITLHPTAYAMAQADSEIQTALSNKPFLTLASA